MIVLHKKAKGYAGICLLLFLAILSCLYTFADGQAAWFSNIFFDKLVVFLLTPPFMVGLLLIEKSVTPVVLTRTKSRIYALLFQLIQQYFLAFVYLSVWFVLVILFSLLKFRGGITELNASDLLQWYFRFLFGFIILTNGAVLLKKSGVKALASASYILVYLFFALEILTVIPELDQQLGVEINLIFSWMFYDGAMGLAVMLILIVGLTAAILLVNKREDIF